MSSSLKHIWVGFSSGVNNVTRLVQSVINPNKNDEKEFFKGPYTIGESQHSRQYSEDWIQVKEDYKLVCPHCRKVDLTDEFEHTINLNESYKLRCPECDWPIYLNLVAFSTLGRVQFPVVVIQGEEENETNETVTPSGMVEGSVVVCVDERVDSDRSTGSLGSSPDVGEGRTDGRTAAVELGLEVVEKHLVNALDQSDRESEFNKLILSSLLGLLQWAKEKD